MSCLGKIDCFAPKPSASAMEDVDLDEDLEAGDGSPASEPASPLPAEPYLEPRESDALVAREPRTLASWPRASQSATSFAGAPTAGNAEGKVAAGVADGLAGYIQAQGLKSPAVMGHSMGGTIAMMLAARSPSLVGKLMVVDMFPNLAVAYFGPGQSPEAVAQRAAGFRAQITDAPADAFKAMQEQVITGMVRTESARAAIVKHSLDSDRQVSGRAMEELLTTDLTPELAKITAPTTVVFAWNSSMPVPAATFGGWYQGAYGPLKGAKVVRIDDAAHFVMIDQPAKFMAEVETFLAG